MYCKMNKRDVLDEMPELTLMLNHALIVPDS